MRRGLTVFGVTAEPKNKAWSGVVAPDPASSWPGPVAFSASPCCTDTGCWGWGGPLGPTNPLSILLAHCCGLDTPTPPCPASGPLSPSFHQQVRALSSSSSPQFPRGAAKRGHAPIPGGRDLLGRIILSFSEGIPRRLNSGSPLNVGYITHPWSREWQPSPVFLPGKSHGQRSVGATVQGVRESWTRLSTHT